MMICLDMVVAQPRLAGVGAAAGCGCLAAPAKAAERKVKMIMMACLNMVAV